MSHSAVPGHPDASALRGWHLAALGAVFAVLVQLWGLYRVAGPPQPPWFPFADKVEHAVGFAVPVLLILLAIALRGPMSWQWPNMRTGVFVVAIFAAHGVVSELVQHQWYRYRTGDPLDVLADWVGIAVGMLLIRLILLRRSHAVESLATL
ncbi:MAG TPA: VanZ family protein [Propionibacteriaceae bacterium]